MQLLGLYVFDIALIADDYTLCVMRQLRALLEQKYRMIVLNFGDTVE